MSVERDADGRFMVCGEHVKEIDGDTDIFGSIVDCVIDTTAPVNRKTIYIITPNTEEAKDFYRQKKEDSERREKSIAMMGA